MPETIDLQALVPSKWDNPGIRLTIKWCVQFEGQSGLTVTVEQERLSPKTGQPVKPRHIITLMDEKYTTVSELLRLLARVFEQGHMTVYGVDEDQAAGQGGDDDEAVRVDGG